jgi:hypothetical protein
MAAEAGQEKGKLMIRLSEAAGSGDRALPRDSETETFATSYLQSGKAEQQNTEATDGDMEKYYAEIATQTALFEKQRSDLETRFLGKWFAFISEKRLGPFDSAVAALREAVRVRELCGGTAPYFIVKVGSEASTA